MIKKIILGVLAVVVLGIVAIAAAVSMQPDEYTVVRSATFDAPPEKVFEQVNDFRNWKAWSPWEKLDPNMKTTLSGPESGKGAGYAWIGNDEVGEGKMTIVESRPHESVSIDLEFIKPFAMSSRSDFAFRPNGDKTDVTWTMKGENGIVGKAFCLVMDMDSLIGKDFEKGFAQMKPIVETAR
jgi:hypothetical protein